MLYVLDTDVVSNLRKQHPNPKLLTWLDKIPPEDTGIPVVTVFEIQLGIEGLRLQGKVGNADEIEGWLEGLLEANGDYIIVPGDRKSKSLNPVTTAHLECRLMSQQNT